MVEALLIAAGLVLLFRQRARLQTLERRLGELEAAFRTMAQPLASATPDNTRGEAERPAELARPPEAAIERPTAENGPGSPDPVPEAPPPSAVPRRPGLEERIGTRWAVWVGGLALGLGGLLLVRYSIENDLVGPGLRVALGSVLALALTGGGEWLRRRELPLAAPAFAKANIPAILTAAGTSTLFAVVYAAYALYGLIGPTPAFVILAIVSLATVAASALHGPAISALGLVAAFGSPLLVSASEPNVPGLVAYLACVAGSGYAVARLRLWRWLAVSGAAGALLWGAVLAIDVSPASAATHALIQTALAILFLAADPHRFTPESEARTDRFASAVLLGFALLAILVAANMGHGLGRPLFAGAVMLMLLGAAYRFPAVASGAASAALVALGTLTSWPVEGEVGAEPITVLDSITSGAPMPAAVGTYLTSALLLGVAVAAASFRRVAGGTALRTAPAAWYLSAATLGPLIGLIVVYGRIESFERSIPFALVAAALAAGFAALARAFRTLEERSEAAGGRADIARLAVGATASAAIGALALGLTMALDRGVLTVTLALTALGTAFVADRVVVPALRYAVAALGLVVAARLAFDPRIMGDDLGRTPFLNWLLFGYGIPALAFGLTARILSRSGRDRVVAICETLAILFSALLVFLEIRHAIHDGDIYAAGFGHLEAGLVVAEGLCFSILTARLALGRGRPLFGFFSLGFAVLSLAWAAATLFVVENPAVTGEQVSGGAVLNTLVPAYLIPALLAAALARAARGVHPRSFVLSAAAFALALELAYACLAVRRLFQGSDVSAMRWTSDGELWSYSLVLLLNGIVLLAFGLLQNRREARLASAACILAAVVKVFLLDLAGLEGLMRALSFVGLGLVLVGIGFAYQRLLGDRSRPDPGSAA